MMQDVHLQEVMVVAEHRMAEAAEASAEAAVHSAAVPMAEAAEHAAAVDADSSLINVD